MKKLIYFLAIFIVLAACSKSDETSNEQANYELDPVYPAEIETATDNFIYRLFTEKDVYDEYGETAIFAELTYIGDEDSIEIYHSASPFNFLIEERVRNFKIDYPMEQPLIVTTLQKDIPMREKYNFSGGYSDTDDADYIEFIQTIINKGFPKGNYVIDGSAQFHITNTLEMNDSNTYDMSGKIGFTVVNNPNH